MRAQGPRAEYAVIRGLLTREVQFSSLESELSDGTIVTTSNTWGYHDAFALPESILHQRLPRATPLAELIASHRERVRDGEAVPTKTLDEMVASVERGMVRLRQHRESVGWITHEELAKLMEGNPPSWVEEVWSAIERLRR